MNFASLDFVLFFFIVVVLYYFLPQRWRNQFLLLASYYFYAVWSFKFLFLLIFTMTLDYWAAIRIASSKTQRARLNYLVFSIVCNLGLLFAFKYFNFFFELIGMATGNKAFSLEIVLPFGISFYTFHAMSYTIDVYRRLIPAERNFIHYSGYVMFFPQLVAGPIARASHLLHQFKLKKKLRVNNILEGSYLIARGYVLKVVMADSLGGFVDAFLGSDVHQSSFTTLQSVYFFAFQIYFDFCGYTDIARGVARIFDFSLVENFNRPYSSTSITEFWKRWHISLSTWLRDYLYIPLGGNRGGELRTYRNLLLTMLLGGLWHGASLTFVAWGGIHGFYLAVERWARGVPGINQRVRQVPRWVRAVITFHLVCFAWIFFRSQSLSQAILILRDCADCFLHPSSTITWASFVGRLWVAPILWLAFEWAEERYELFRRFPNLDWVYQSAIAYAVIAFVALFAELNPKSFIYFQF